MKYVWMFGAACLALAVALPAMAQTSQQPTPPRALSSRISPGSTLERYLETVPNVFQELDADANGVLNADDVVLQEAVTSANSRMQFAVQIMSADLNGDGVVTENELRQKFRYDRRMRANRQTPSSSRNLESEIERQIRDFMMADADRDGRVTWLETLEFTKTRPTYAQMIESGQGVRLRELLTFIDKKSVTLSEFETAATALFRTVDADGNGTISQDESLAFRRNR